MTLRLGHGRNTEILPLRDESTDRGPKEYARLVEREMDGTILRYSQRQRLIREGERRGLSRFEANLVIAVVEHRKNSQVKARPQQASSMPGWVWFIVIQFVLLCGYGVIWWA
jgi:hypothetical protein